MTDVIFEGGKIQVGDRIKIPKPIIDTLKLKKGEKITISFRPDKKEIVIKQSEKPKRK